MKNVVKRCREKKCLGETFVKLTAIKNFVCPHFSNENCCFLWHLSQGVPVHPVPSHPALAFRAHTGTQRHMGAHETCRGHGAIAPVVVLRAASCPFFNYRSFATERT